MANNTARDSGGAVYISKAANLTFINGSNTLARNKAVTGGAMYLNESQLFFSGGNSKLVSNEGENGGGIYASESNCIVEEDSQIQIQANSAIHHGGGLYLAIASEIKIKGEHTYITKNRAKSNGGGIHADNSTLIIKGAVHLINNEAENGGGAISLERNAKLTGENGTIHLISNRAKLYGGAVYVDDKTNSDICVGKNDDHSSKIECFSKSVFLSFSENFAAISGTNLFGVLLNKCTVHDTELYQTSERT